MKAKTGSGRCRQRCCGDLPTELRGRYLAPVVGPGPPDVPSACARRRSGWRTSGELPPGGITGGTTRGIPSRTPGKNAGGTPVGTHTLRTVIARRAQDGLRLGARTQVRVVGRQIPRNRTVRTEALLVSLKFGVVGAKFGATSTYNSNATNDWR